VTRASRFRRLRLLATSVVAAVAAPVAGQAAARARPPAAPAAARVSPGERLYMRGFSVSGVAVEATVQGDVHVKSTEMACANCHRRSGMGGAEGPLVVPPIVASVLFSPVTQGAPQIGTPRTTGPGTREAYTEETLLRAVRDGVDASGRTLSATMPRYAIGDADAKALGAFLRGLGEGATPGVDDAIVHVATIVTPGVDAGARASMLDVLRAFVRAKNGGTRYEARRRTSGGWDMKQQYQNYRDWVLSEWELRGTPKEWPAQLEALYRRQPVYAIVGGITEGDWSPVDAFCARHKIPAVLPQSPLPPADPAGDDFYSLYFSRGVVVEARAIARHLEAARPGSELRQISRCGTAGQAAATELTRAFPAAAARTACVPAATSLTAETWRTVVGSARRLVLWLDGRDQEGLHALAASGSLDGVSEVYLSSTLLGDAALRLPAPLAERAVLAHPFVTPDEFDRHAARSLLWMSANGLRPADRRVAVNALFAVVLAADALTMPRTLGSRDYFVETIEHMAGRSLNPTAYPSVSFDPRRRFASEGAYLLKVPSSPDQPFGKVEEWSVPRS
jgi:hypothetical protein